MVELITVRPSLAFEPEGMRTRIEQSLTFETGVHPNSSKKFDRLCKDYTCNGFSVIHIIMMDKKHVYNLYTNEHLQLRAV